ncbi:permease [Hydrogenimonas sp.]
MKMRFQGLRFMGAVMLLYGALFFYDAGRAEAALRKSAVVFVEILAIFSVVVFLTAAINYYVRANELARHLGEESGMRGQLIALAAGVLSHGPMYAWYPMLKDLRSHGMTYGLMAAFFYARAIKVPLLPIMVDYFGLAFTVILSFYILVAAWIQGVIVDRLCADCG